MFCGGTGDVCFYVEVRGHEWSSVHAVVNSRKWALKRDYEKVVFDLLIELSCFFLCGSATDSLMVVYGKWMVGADGGWY